MHGARPAPLGSEWAKVSKRAERTSTRDSERLIEQAPAPANMVDAESRDRRRFRTGLARRSAHLHVLVMVNAPVLLWTSGAAMFGLGLWRRADIAVGFGAAAMIAGLVLTRARGTFKAGPQGVEANVDPGLVDAIVEEAIQSGVPPEDAPDILDGATYVLGEALAPTDVHSRPEVQEARRSIARSITRSLIGEASELRSEVQAQLRAGSDQHGWHVIESAGFPDFEVQGESWRVYLELRLNVGTDRLREIVNAWYRLRIEPRVPDRASFAVVVPDNMKFWPSVGGRAREQGVTIVTLEGLLPWIESELSGPEPEYS